MSRADLGWVAASALLLVVVSLVSAGEPSGGMTVDTVRVVPQEYRARLAELSIENSGLRARLEGVREVAPTVIYQTDTLIAPPDTVVRYVTVNARGRISFELLASADSLYVPEIHEGADVSTCDDGYHIDEGGRVICDPARFGHLWAGPWLKRRPSLAAWWTPSYRSPWEASVEWLGGDRWDVGLRRGVQIW